MLEWDVDTHQGLKEKLRDRSMISYYMELFNYFFQLIIY
jgi:hypothetical protein